MSARIGDAFPHVGAKGIYDYDFGSTTTLSVGLMHAREARLGRSAVRLVARNDAPVWPCGICSEAASSICAVHEREDSPFVCARRVCVRRLIERARPVNDAGCPLSVGRAGRPRRI